MITGLSLALTNSKHKIWYLISPNIVSHSPKSISVKPTSTRFNNSDRFSLEQLKNNKRRLESFKKLRKNWNNYNGEEFEESLITRIEDIITYLDYQPQIYPTGRGSIQLEKYINENNLVEIEVSNDEIFAYQVIDGREIEKEITIDEINTLISELYA